LEPSSRTRNRPCPQQASQLPPFFPPPAAAAYAERIPAWKDLGVEVIQVFSDGAGGKQYVQVSPASAGPFFSCLVDPGPAAAARLRLWPPC
jgi:hypothetical protein